MRGGGVRGVSHVHARVDAGGVGAGGGAGGGGGAGVPGGGRAGVGARFPVHAVMVGARLGSGQLHCPRGVLTTGRREVSGGRCVSGGGGVCRA
ncbi:hypothetical protein EST54_26285, partial [Streptomyces sioyaensis]